MKKWFGITTIAVVVLGGACLYALSVSGYWSVVFGRPPLAAELPVPSDDEGVSVAAGQAAYTSLEFNDARAIWRAVAEDESTEAEDRGDALRHLARVSWRLWDEPEMALDFLRQADAIDPGNSDTFAQRAYALIAEGRLADAVDAARLAIRLAGDSSEMGDARRALGTAALAFAGQTAPREFTPAQRAALEDADAAFAIALQEPPVDLATSELALAVAIRLGNGPLALTAWQSYYHHASGISALADVRDQANALAADLPGWSWDAATSTQARVAEAFAGSHFHGLAAFMTDHVPGLASNAVLVRNHLYNDFIDAMRTTTIDYYRGYAVEGATGGEYTAAVAELLAIHGEHLYPGENFSIATSEQFLERLEDEFQTYGSIGMTSGVLDLHMGHITLDAQQPVSQYGYEAEMRYIVVGRMVSNGYESWIWDGTQQHGGWARSDTIYQVRDAYAGGPLDTWRQITEPELRTELDERIAELRLADADLAADGEAVHLPGLALSLRVQGQRDLYERLRQEVAPDQLRSEFVTQLGTAIREHSIFAHEGRHALDKTFVEDEQGTNLSSAELEFRAKLSEVAFAPYPRLAFGAIINATLGNGTSHGTANERVVTGLIAWMGVHQDDIDGLDATAPLLPQFDLLSDAQMVAAVQSMDPWVQ